MPPDGSLASCYGNQHFSQLKTLSKILKFVDCGNMKCLKTLQIDECTKHLCFGTGGSWQEQRMRKKKGHISAGQTPGWRWRMLGEEDIWLISTLYVKISSSVVRNSQGYSSYFFFFFGRFLPKAVTVSWWLSYFYCLEHCSAHSRWQCIAMKNSLTIIIIMFVVQLPIRVWFFATPRTAAIGKNTK